MAILRMLPLAFVVLGAALCTPGCDIVSEKEFDSAVSTFDADGDGYLKGDGEGFDCNDNNPDIHPDAEEICDGIDNNCTGAPDAAYEMDEDEDGYLRCILEEGREALGGFLGGGDCDDDDDEIHPTADEYCDEIDQDCDGDLRDEHSLDVTTWYADTDSDGHGDPNVSEHHCDMPPGFAPEPSDCNDSDATMYPEADQLCDGVDNTCAGSIPDDETDNDGDTYVECTYDSAVWSGDGTVSGGEDCNDTDATIFPGATELCDGILNDCAATELPADETDDDGDTYVECTYESVVWVGDITITGGEDCDDTDASLHPATVWYADTDQDAFGDPTATTLIECVQPSGYVLDNTDCDDNADDINPAQVEVCDPNDTDEDCNGAIDDGDANVEGQADWYIDSDSDGFGGINEPVITTCDTPAGSANNNTDCDDTRAHVNPNATEICDGGDTNCDGDTTTPPFDEDDSDGDGYVNCVVDPTVDWLGTGLPQGGDCDDTRFNVNPASTEVCDLNDTDENCDGFADDNDPAVDASSQTNWYPDSDGDSYGDHTAPGDAYCDAPNGWVDNNHDCNEGVHNAHNTTYYTDDDQDGWGLTHSPFEDYDLGCPTTTPNFLSEQHGDCDDSLATVSPGVAEDCSNSVDNDCDGSPPSTDSDCSSSCAQETYEICDDGCDNNYDGLIDCADNMMCGQDPACGGGSGGVVAEDGTDPYSCSDGDDDDGDGDVDCCDLDCAQYQCCLTPSCPQNNGPQGSNSCGVAQNHCTSAADCSDTLCTDTFTALCVDPTPTNTVAAPTTIPDFTQLTCGALHTCGLTNGGQVNCWGDNAANQSDIPTGAHSLSFSEIVAGAEHTCGLTEDLNGDEKVVCWGDNTVGQSGGTTISTGFYEAFSGSGPYTNLAAGYYHTCVALDDGSIECVGDDTYGQRDTSALATIQSEMLANNSNSIEVLSAGGFHTCAIDDNNHLYCWGRDDINQVGGPNGSTNTYSDVATGELYTCALKTNAQGVTCWGDIVLWDSTSPWNTNQPPGSSEPYDSGNGNLTDFDKLFSGGHHICSTVMATPTGGGNYDTVACWGWDDDGQVSDGPLTTTGGGTVTDYLNQNGQIRAGCSGARHNCFYYEASGNGYLECWGDNCQGQACTTSSCSSGTCP
ncbi:MAG: MopE-related protein [Myxococcota bacterium]|nr:MopE-related protein [Myxococcota bacterium]